MTQFQFTFFSFLFFRCVGIEGGYFESGSRKTIKFYPKPWGSTHGTPGTHVFSVTRLLVDSVTSVVWSESRWLLRGPVLSRFSDSLAPCDRALVEDTLLSNMGLPHRVARLCWVGQTRLFPCNPASSAPPSARRYLLRSVELFRTLIIGWDGFSLMREIRSRARLSLTNNRLTAASKTINEIMITNNRPCRGMIWVSHLENESNVLIWISVGYFLLLPRSNSSQSTRLFYCNVTTRMPIGPLCWF